MLTPKKRMNLAHRHTIVAIGLLGAAVTSALVVAIVVYAGGGGGSTHAVNSSLRLSRAARHGKPTRLNVFSRHLRVRTRFAKASSLTGPSVLAGTFGGMQVYLSERGGLICIRIHEGITESAGCARREEVQDVGDLNVHGSGTGRIGIVLVVPNGVESVTLFDHDGSSRQIRVRDNVVGAYDSQVESVTYSLAGGELHTTRIPAEFLHPKPPGLTRKSPR
jgi:hypothetical protein